jgi:toxin ParE1/3/4
MGERRYRLTEIAERDVRDILRESARQFGPVQRRNYAALIDEAATLIADQPERPGSRMRDELADGLRSFHVELAARRRGAATHVLFYLEGRLEDGRDGVIIVRVLHERMDPLRHIGAGLGTLSNAATWH